MQIASTGIETTLEQDRRAFDATRVKLTFSDLEYFVNYVYFHRSTPINEILDDINSKVWYRVECDDIDNIMMWLRQVFNEHGVTIQL